MGVLTMRSVAEEAETMELSAVSSTTLSDTSDRLTISLQNSQLV